MADNMHVTTEHESPINWPEVGREIATHQVLNLVPKDVEEFTVYLVWFAFILGGWKGLYSTTIPDGRYYEVTFNKEKNEAYVDTYRKTHNVCVKFETQQDDHPTLPI